MEKIYITRKAKENIELPPGFRFHPTDEELITQYLNPKVYDPTFESVAIGEADLNKCEPWDLPSKAKMGEREWYFFFARDRKYPTGSRTNRATEGGYYKATGKDKEIFRGPNLVGMKKTLVFYKGRAPRGEKTNWVMHEYRLEGQFSMYNLLNPAAPPSMNSQSEWVISRIFEKSSGGKKAPDFDPVGYDPMSYFSGPEDPEDHVIFGQDQMINTTTDNINHNNANTNTNTNTNTTTTSLILSNEINAQDMNIIAPSDNLNDESFYDPNLEFQDSILAMLCHGNENGENMNMESVMMGSSKKKELSGGIGTDNVPSTSGGPVDIDCLWNY